MPVKFAKHLNSWRSYVCQCIDQVTLKVVAKPLLKHNVWMNAYIRKHAVRLLRAKRCRVPALLQASVWIQFELLGAVDAGGHILFVVPQGRQLDGRVRLSAPSAPPLNLRARATELELLIL